MKQEKATPNKQNYKYLNINRSIRRSNKVVKIKYS